MISHQNSLNTTFKDIDTKFKGLSSGSSFDPKQARTLIDQFVANAKSAGAQVEQDDSSLVAARSSLDEQQWLTVLSRGNLDKESARIEHARKALTSAKTVSGDYVLDGQFLQAFMDAAIDLDTLGTQSANADLTSAKTTLTTMKTHVDKALELSTAPGLPKELHDLMVDFQSLVAERRTPTRSAPMTSTRSGPRLMTSISRWSMHSTRRWRRQRPRPRVTPSFAEREPDVLGRQQHDQADQHRYRRGAQPGDGVPGRGHDDKDDRSLKPVGDEQADHLRRGGLEESQATAGRRTSCTASWDAAR